MDSPIEKLPGGERGFYEPYSAFARIVRTWLVAYGVGAPVIFLSNQHIFTQLKSSDSLTYVALLFGLGVGFQLIPAILLRTAMWYLYLGELHADFQSRWRYHASYWISEQYWLEAGSDLVSIILYIFATISVLRALSAVPCQDLAPAACGIAAILTSPPC